MRTNAFEAIFYLPFGLFFFQLIIILGLCLFFKVVHTPLPFEATLILIVVITPIILLANKNINLYIKNKINISEIVLLDCNQISINSSVRGNANISFSEIESFNYVYSALSKYHYIEFTERNNKRRSITYRDSLTQNEELNDAKSYLNTFISYAAEYNRTSHAKIKPNKGVFNSLPASIFFYVLILIEVVGIPLHFYFEPKEIIGFTIIVMIFFTIIGFYLIRIRYKGMYSVLCKLINECENL